MIPNRPEWTWWDWVGWGTGMFVVLFIAFGPAVILVYTLLRSIF